MNQLTYSAPLLIEWKPTGQQLVKHHLNGTLDECGIPNNGMCMVLRAAVQIHVSAVIAKQVDRDFYDVPKPWKYNEESN